MTMIGPMAVLVACCFLIGLAPILVVPILEDGNTAWARRHLGFDPATGNPGTIWLNHGDGHGVNRRVVFGECCISVAASSEHRGKPDDLGLRLCRPDATHAVHVVVVRSDAGRPVRLGTPSSNTCARNSASFPQESSFHSDVPDTVLDEAVVPAFRFGGWLFSWFRVFQQGSIQTYLLYIFIALIALLLWR